MKPEDLYERLERIFELDEIIRYKHENEKLEIGDEDAIEYNKLYRTMQNLDLKDWKEYHLFLKDKNERELFEQKEELKEKLKVKLENKVEEFIDCIDF